MAGANSRMTTGAWLAFALLGVLLAFGCGSRTTLDDRPRGGSLGTAVVTGSSSSGSITGSSSGAGSSTGGSSAGGSSTGGSSAGGSSTGGSSTGGSSTGGSSAGSSGGGSNSGGSGGSGASGSSSSGGSEGSSGSSGGAQGSSSGGGPSSGGLIDGGTSGTIPCGATTCSAATDQCCVQIGGGISAACSPKGVPCPGVSVACSSAANCSTGESCCLALGLGGGGAVCQSACTPGLGGLIIQLCSTTAECPAGQVCTATAAFGFRACF